MMTKTEKLSLELEKARAKRIEWEERVKDLEVRLKEAQNTEIHEMVRAANLTPAQLAELLGITRKGNLDEAANLIKETSEDED
ncbi:MAG: DUF4315 family protein [Pseudobutyrivibrio sp.]|nr:DUF4315 family protein [Pseudobutyrivibrio sp.]MCF0185885.1 DUF4315 family protein [Bacteroidaceae bacterium]MCF0186766.1 DUF4315 family protein [Bacteroidaceae bacterium]